MMSSSWNFPNWAEHELEFFFKYNFFNSICLYFFFLLLPISEALQLKLKYLEKSSEKSYGSSQFSSDSSLYIRCEMNV